MTEALLPSRVLQHPGSSKVTIIASLIESRVIERGGTDPCIASQPCIVHVTLSVLTRQGAKSLVAPRCSPGVLKSQCLAMVIIPNYADGVKPFGRISRCRDRKPTKRSGIGRFKNLKRYGKSVESPFRNVLVCQTSIYQASLQHTVIGAKRLIEYLANSELVVRVDALAEDGKGSRSRVVVYLLDYIIDRTTSLVSNATLIHLSKGRQDPGLVAFRNH